MARSRQETKPSPQEPAIAAPVGASTLQDVLYALDLALHAVDTLSPDALLALGSRPSLAELAVRALRAQVRVCRDNVQLRIAARK